MVYFLITSCKALVMKKLLLIAALGLFSLTGVYAQENAQQKERKEAHKDLKDTDVPPAIREAFDKQFSNTTMVNWKMKDGKYVAMFTQDMKKQMAEFNQAGELLAKGEKIEKDALPAPVTDAVKTAYSGSNIEEVYRIEKDGQTQFKVKLDGNPKKIAIYDSQGKLLKEKTAQQ